METFANLSESDRSQSKSEHNCLGQVAFHQATCAMALQSKVVIHRGCGYSTLKVLATSHNNLYQFPDAFKAITR